jgi:hypothetical protein
LKNQHVDKKKTQNKEKPQMQVDREEMFIEAQKNGISNVEVLP